MKNYWKKNSGSDDEEAREKSKEEVNDKVSKTLVEGEEFKKLQKQAKKLGAKSLDYSKGKHNKYFVTLENGKKIHFGNRKYEDYLLHKDDGRRKKYLAQVKKIKNKKINSVMNYQNELFTGACTCFGLKNKINYYLKK